MNNFTKISYGAIHSRGNVSAMDPSIWRQLPTELHLSILQFSSSSDLIRFKGVSKEWRSSIKGIVLARSMDLLARSMDPWIIRGPPNSVLSIYNTGKRESGMWQPFPYSRRLSNLLFTGISAGGLMCFVGPKDLFVYNPSTMDLLKLPPSPHYNKVNCRGNAAPAGICFDKHFNCACSHFVGMEVLDSGSYRMFLVHKGGEKDQFQCNVHESETGKWNPNPNYIPLLPEERDSCFMGNAYGKTAIINSTFYFVITSNSGYTLKSFHFAHEKVNTLVSWNQVSNCNFYLVACGGKLMQVRSHEVFHSSHLFLDILVFNQKNSKWDHLSTLPHQLIEGLVGEYCCHRATLSLSASETQVLISNSLKSVVYDILLDNWFSIDATWGDKFAFIKDNV